MATTIKSKADLLNLSKAVDRVTVEEVGDVCLRQVSYEEFAQMRRLADNAGDGADDELALRMIAATLCDDTGSRLFDNGIEEVRQLPTSTVMRLLEPVRKACGLDILDLDEDELLGKSETTAKSAGGSGLPRSGAAPSVKPNSDAR